MVALGLRLSSDQIAKLRSLLSLHMPSPGQEYPGIPTAPARANLGTSLGLCVSMGKMGSTPTLLGHDHSGKPYPDQAQLGSLGRALVWGWWPALRPSVPCLTLGCVLEGFVPGLGCLGHGFPQVGTRCRFETLHYPVVRPVRQPQICKMGARRKAIGRVKLSLSNPGCVPDP